MKTTVTVAIMAVMSLSLALAIGADVSITGTLKDSAGKPLGGVTVGVQNSTIKAVSADDGSFKLAGAAGAPASQPSGVLGKILAGKVPVAAAKEGFMPVRVLAKDNAAGLQLTMYPVLKGNVTLIGNLLGSAHTLGIGRAADAEHSVFMLAFDGDPGIRAEFDQIVNDYWPEGGTLDGDAARELENQFMERLKCNLDGPMYDKMWNEVKQHPYVNAVTVTGEVRYEDKPLGNRWISTTSYGSTKFKYPEKMVAPYKPLVMPDKPKLEIKLNDKVSITLIHVPAGRFYMGCPLYQIPHWQEGPQHMVTLTKGYYMAETPLTYEQYAAVTGETTANEYKDYKTGAPGTKDPRSAAGLSCKMFLNFCKLFSEKTGKVVRPPTAAELEYAARCGCSNPSCSPDGSKRVFPMDPAVEQKYDAPLKNTAPNAWGFYQMLVFKSSERTSDEEGASASEHKDVVDPHYPVKQDSMEVVPESASGSNARQHCCKGSEGFPIQEMMRSGCGRGIPFENEWNNMAKRERIVIEDDGKPVAPAK